MQPRRGLFRRTGGFRLNRLEWRSMTSHSAELRPHPTSSCDAIRRFGVRIEPSAHAPGWRIRFRIEGTTSSLRLPLPGIRAPQRRSLATYLLRGIPPGRCERHLLRIQLRTVRGMGGVSILGGRRTDRSSPGMPAPSISFPAHCGWLRIDRQYSDCGACPNSPVRPSSAQDFLPSSSRRTEACPGGRSRTRATSPTSMIHRHSRFA